MAKYNFYDLEHDSPGYWAIIRVLVLSGMDVDKIDKANVDVSLTFEGRDVPFVDFINLYLSQLDDLIEARARSIVNEKLFFLLSDVDRFSDAIREATESIDLKPRRGE